MKKRSLLLITVLMIALLSTLSTPVYAGPPTPAEGLWQYLPTILDARVAGGNTFLTTSEIGQWTGTFSGGSIEAGHVVIHSAGFTHFKAIVSFASVTVDNRMGSLEMRVNGSRPYAGAEWEGRWAITEGTGELEGLRGQGTWWGPGAPRPGEWGDIYYSGNVHFDLD